MQLGVTVLFLQTPPAPQMSLREAEIIAEENHPELRALRQERAIANENIKVKFRDFFPSVSLSYRQSRTVAQREFDNGSQSVQLNISQPIYDGGRTSLAHEVAKLDASISTEKYKKARNDLKLRVRTAFFALQQQKGQMDLARLSIKSTDLLYKRAVIERRQDAIALIDFREIENEHKRRQFALEKQEAAYRSSIADFAHTLHLPPGSEPALVAIDLTRAVIRDSNRLPDELKTLAEENSPELRQARLDVYRSRKEYLITSHDYLPSVSLTGHYGRTGEEWPPRSLDWGVGINVTIPLQGSTLRTDAQYNSTKADTQRGLSEGGEFDFYNNPGYRAAGMRNELQLFRARANREDLRRNIDLRIDKFARETRERNNELSLLAEKVSISELRNTVEYRKYISGQTALHDYLEEEIKLQQARADLLEKRVESILAVGQFEADIGLELDYLGLIDLPENNPAPAPGQSAGITP